MTWMMITDLDGKLFYSDDLNSADPLLSDISSLVPEGKYIQVIINDYGTRNSIIHKVRRIDVANHHEDPTFQLSFGHFSDEDWPFPTTVHFYMDGGFTAKTVIHDLASLYRFGESYRGSFYVEFDDGSEVEFNFVPGVSRKVQTMIKTLY